jgi:putative ABC transport system substrate-binding protein
MRAANEVVRRREFITLTAVGLVAAIPRAARAQPASLPRVAFPSVAFGSEAPVFEAFKDELRALGQIDGKTFRFELHVAPDNQSVPVVAEEIVRSRPAVLVALNVVAGGAFHRLTQDIPIVVVSSPNPLGVGWSTSVARPSRNVTGVLDLIDDLAAKRVEILRALVPAAQRVGVLYEADNPEHATVLANTTAASAQSTLTVLPFDLGGDLTETLIRIAAARLDGLIVVASPFILTHRQEVIGSALASRLPTMHAFAFEADDGGLVAYGTNTVENFQRAAQYVDRLLGGAKIADLPFDAPRSVTLTLNQRTARAIGLEISPSHPLARR